MNRILLGLICCCPLLLNVSAVQSVELVGPYDDENVIQTSPKPVTRSVARSIAPTTYGPIKSSETLWSIATKLRPNNNVSVYQTIAAIYKFNPNAFLDGDINKIISSSRIRVPSAGFVAQQTDAEAMRLLNPPRKVVTKPIANPPVKPVVKKEVVKAPVVAPIEEKVPVKEVVDASLLDELKKELDGKEEALTNNQALLTDQEKELTKLSEQLIVVTEANQLLKLKLQPLSDQIDTLSVQVDEDIKTQAELQAVIDEYRKQIDAFEAPPFSGEGMLNAILRSITSSTSVLLLSMLVPLLLLTAIFLFILRLKSKRELDLKEQELAESTSLLSDDESGDFDEFLSDEVDHTITEEIVDLDNDEDLIQQAPEIDEIIKLDDEEIDKDKAYTDTELIEDDVTEDDFKFDDAHKDEIIELSEIDFDVDEDSDQADLDLAAAWEAQINDEKTDTDIDIDELAALEAEFAEAPTTEKETEAANLDEDIPSVEESTEIEDNAPEEIEQQTETVIPVEETKVTDTEEVIDLDDIATDEATVAIAEDTPTVTEDIVELEDSAPENRSPDIEPEVIAEAAQETVGKTEDPIVDVSEELDVNVAKEPDIDSAKEIITEANEEDKASATDKNPVDSISDEIEPNVTTEEEIDVTMAELDETSVETEYDVDSDLAEAVKTPVTEEVTKQEEAPLKEVESDDLTIEEAVSEPENVVEDEAAALEQEVELESTTEKLEDETELILEDEAELNDDLEKVELDTAAEVDDEERVAFDETDNAGPKIESPAEVEHTISDEIEPDAEDEIAFESDEDDNEFAKSLGEQFNQNAFKEDVELPTIDKNDDKGFIDIDTLLTGTDGAELTEEEFNLDFGLDEFPDVVEFSEFDNDADGVAAQLDLARAYLEIDEKESAKDILNKLLDVAKDGKLKEVQKLLKRIN
jgi:pilus assembly protein FimV